MSTFIEKKGNSEKEKMGMGYFSAILADAIGSFRNRKILVIGDAVLDHFIYGEPLGISPDAPVPLIGIADERHIPGSLFRIIDTVIGLKADTEVICAVANDYAGNIILKELHTRNLGIKGVFFPDKMGAEAGHDFEIRTPAITRIIARNQQILRMETLFRIPKRVEKELNNAVDSFLEERIERFDAVIVADYNAGFLNPVMISKIVNRVSSAGIKLIVRPESGKYVYYRNPDVIIMNRSIAAAATGVTPLNETSLRIIGTKIKNETAAEAVFIPWLDGDSYLFTENDRVTVYPTFPESPPRSYINVGSTIIATAALMLTCGYSYKEVFGCALAAAAVAALKKDSSVITVNDITDKGGA